MIGSHPASKGFFWFLVYLRGGTRHHYVRCASRRLTCLEKATGKSCREMRARRCAALTAVHARAQGKEAGGLDSEAAPFAMATANNHPLRTLATSPDIRGRLRRVDGAGAASPHCRGRVEAALEGAGQGRSSTAKKRDG